MADHSQMKLGKRAPKRDRRTLMLASYTSALPDAPPAASWTGKVSGLGMMRNDVLGDCTCAAIGHMIQVWTSQTGQEVVLTDDQVVDLYERACGYNPSDPSTDCGGVELDVLKWWRKETVAGVRPIDAFAAPQPRSHTDVMDAIWLFGGCYAGVNLPLTAQTQEVWSVVPQQPYLNPGLVPSNDPSAPGSWGGHAVPIVSYGPRGLVCATWGAWKWMTWEFFDAYVDEAYACLSRDWATATGAPSGFMWQALDDDIAAIQR